jgi:predicted enzyme related to lactoylglutathione lyase
VTRQTFSGLVKASFSLDLMARFTMVEFPSGSAADSAAFFEKAFGWSHCDFGPEYTDVALGNGQSLGFQQNASEAPEGPLVVVEVDDLDVARSDVLAAGGTISVEPFDFPGGRRFHFREPGGNELAAWVPRES